MTLPSNPSTVSYGALKAVLAQLTGRRVAVTLVTATIGTLIVSPIFETPLPTLLTRAVPIAMALLLAFLWADQWHGRGIPKWAMQIIAMATAAPLATFIAYWITSGGLQGFIAAPARVSGFFIITVACIVIGIPMALGTMVRERDARNHSQALDLALAKEQLERQTSDAKLALLQAQIEPHFLFNTLANVQELVDTGSPQAGPVFKALIAYLRATMPQLQRATATLGDEARLVQSYLELMAMRMPDRLNYEFTLDEDVLDLRFPAMALLTLVENAIRHGLDPTEDGGKVTVGAHRNPSSGAVNVWVADSGVGMQETSTPGTGLANLRQRLAVFFGPGSQLEFSEPAGGGLRVDLHFSPAANI